jgi:hypothetical protein
MYRTRGPNCFRQISMALPLSIVRLDDFFLAKAGCEYESAKAALTIVKQQMSFFILTPSREIFGQTSSFRNSAAGGGASSSLF